ncbi:hypothetical protein BDW69DRAFT_159499 [Aspergillus filifer]
MILTHNDDTVAWICALPLEMAAAKVIRDSRRDSRRALPGITGPLHSLPGSRGSTRNSGRRSSDKLQVPNDLLHLTI